MGSLPLLGAGPISPAAPPPPVDLLTGLIALWEADEASGNLLDAHTAGPYDLTDVNGVGAGVGLINGARALVRASTHSFASSNAALRPTSTQDWSFSLWINPNASTSGYWTLLGGDGFGGQKQYILLEDGTRRLWRWDGFNTGVAIAASVWTHIVYTYASGGTDTGSEKFYVNSVEIASRTGAVPAPGSGFRLGRDGSAGSHGFDGRFDQTGLWITRCLGQTEVDALFNSGAGLPYGSFT